VPSGLKMRVQPLRTRNCLFVAASTKLTFTGAHSRDYSTPQSWSEFDANRTSGRGSAIDAAMRSASSWLSGNRCEDVRKLLGRRMTIWLQFSPQ